MAAVDYKHKEEPATTADALQSQLLHLKMAK
jgi:hypothetical protein